MGIFFHKNNKKDKEKDKELENQSIKISVLQPGLSSASSSNKDDDDDDHDIKKTLLGNQSSSNKKKISKKACNNFIMMILFFPLKIPLLFMSCYQFRNVKIRNKLCCFSFYLFVLFMIFNVLIIYFLNLFEFLKYGEYFINNLILFLDTCLSMIKDYKTCPRLIIIFKTIFEKNLVVDVSYYKCFFVEFLKYSIIFVILFYIAIYIDFCLRITIKQKKTNFFIKSNKIK